MADVLISLDDEKEKMLRELARELYGGKKGSLSETASEAIRGMYTEYSYKHRKASLNRLIETMEKGYNIGLGKKKPYEKRGELYAGRVSNFA